MELKLTASEVTLEINVPSESRELSLLEPALIVEELELKEVSCLETTLYNRGRVLLRGGHGSTVHLSAPRSFAPELFVSDSSLVTLAAAGRGMIRMSLVRQHPEVPEEPGRGRQQDRQALTRTPPPDLAECGDLADPGGGWRGHIVGDSEMAIDGLGVSESLQVPPVVDVSSNRTKSWVNFALPAAGPTGARMVVLDPGQGKIVARHRLPEPISEARSVIWKDRIVLLEPETTPQRWSLLRPDLQIRKLELTLWETPSEPRSALLGGTVRFPAGEKEGLELERGFFLSAAAPPDRSLVLRSLDSIEERLELVLWGEAAALEIGPTPQLQREQLPSYLQWLHTHKPANLLIGTWIAISTTLLTSLKFLGIGRH